MPELLALLGGNPVQPEPLAPYISIGQEEKDAVGRVMDCGILSGFAACRDARFYGGKLVNEFESQFSEMCQISHAVSFNSATSALIAAVGALGLGLGDEVIVPAQTMSASAACVLAYNAVPVFADVETRTFGLDPDSVRSTISEKTKALVVVHLYGHPARMGELLAIAKQHNLKIIEDCAQSPLATYKGKYTGTFGDIGVYSLNVHKHLNCGEGGVAITQDADLKERLALIRNHGEVKGTDFNLSNTIGWNFRLTELQAAIAIERTKKLHSFVAYRKKLSEILTSLLEGFVWVQGPIVEDNCEHSYYDYPMHFDLSYLGVSKEKIMEVTRSENMPITESYRPLYWQQIYQNKIVYGQNGFPFSHSLSEQNWNNYRKGSCPNAEAMYEGSCLTFEICSYALEELHMRRIAKMFQKIEAASRTGNLSP